MGTQVERFFLELQVVQRERFEKVETPIVICSDFVCVYEGFFLVSDVPGLCVC